MDCLNAWKISNRLFYPLGIYNFGDHSKTVIIIWSLDKLITLAFRGIQDAINQNKAPYKMYEITSNGEVLDVISTKTNTICLSDQECAYFASYKTIVNVPTMTNIKKIKSYSKGFVCVRNSEEVSIELYDDKLVRVKSYNLDWEAIPTQSQRNSEIYALSIICVTNENKNFLKTLLKVEEEDLRNLNEIILFSIDSTLYWLQTDNGSDDYNVVTLQTSVTNISSIFYSKNQKILILLLQCGILEILHQSEQKIKISQIFFENEIIYYNFLEENLYNLFIYSTMLGLYQSNIIYDCNLDEYKAETRMQSIFGVTCFTYIEIFKIIICATANNCFYSTKLQFGSEINEINLMVEDNTKLINIDDEFMKQNRNFEECLINEMKTFNEIKNQATKIQANWKQLGVISNECFINNLNENYCVITAHDSMPPLSDQCFVPTFTYKPKTVFLKFQLFIKINLRAIIEYDKMWKTFITLCDIHGANNCYSFELSNYDLALPVDFLLAYQSSNKYFTLPKVEVFLGATVDLNQESIFIKIPVHLRNENDYYTALMEVVEKPLKCFRNNNITLIDKTLSRLNQKDILPVNKEFKFNFFIPSNFNKEHLIKIFPKSGILEMDKELFITFNKSNVKLIIDTGLSSVIVSSDDPGALLYVKMYFITNLIKMFDHHQLPGHVIGKLQILLTSLHEHLDFRNVKIGILTNLLHEVRELSTELYFPSIKK